MNRRAWRLVKRRHAAHAFDGEGARLYGGRWNSPGVVVVYASASPSLAALELLIHLESAEVLGSYLLFEMRFDDSLVSPVDASELPPRWRDGDPPVELRLLGDSWIRDRRSVVLQVPSALVPEEPNFLFNPRHPDFRRVGIPEPRPFDYDPRVLKGPPTPR